MSLKSRISEWWTGQKDANKIVQVQMVELAGTGYSKPVLIHRRDSQLIAHVLSRGRNSLTIWIESCLLMGVGLGLLCSLLFNPDSGYKLSLIAAAAVCIFWSCGALTWLGWGFRYQRGVP